MNDELRTEVNPSAFAAQSVCCPLCGDASNLPYRTERTSIAGQIVLLGLNRCKKCGMHFVSPRLTDRAQAEFYNSMYMSATVSGQYNVSADVSIREYEAFTRYAVKYLRRDSKILDVGCGVGNLLKEFAKSQFVNISGVELSSTAGKMASDSGLDVTVGDLHGLRLPAESQDCVVLLYVLEHVPDPLHVVQECVRILKRGGYLMAAVPNYRYLRLVYENPLLRVLKRNPLTLHPEEHLQNFTPATFKELMLRAGLDVQEVGCARALGIGAPWLRVMKSIADFGVQILFRLGIHLGGIHLIAQKRN